MLVLLNERSDPPKLRHLHGYSRVMPGRRYLLIRCDACSKEYETTYTKKYAEQREHFCSRKCSQAMHQHIRLQAAASQESVAKRKATNLKRYGVESTLALPEVHQKGMTLEAWKKRHQTMRQNHTYRSSRAEDMFYEFLVRQFEHVTRWKRVYIWPIDFHIPSIDTYVQFDGEHWHGLDRPLQEIQMSPKHHDQVIYRKWCSDREQDTWFTERGLRLIRITDRQFAQGTIPDELKKPIS